MNRNRSAFLLVLAGAGIVGTGCTDRSPFTVSAPERLTVETSTDPERQALTAITRLVALALQSEELRQDVLQSMRSSPFKERKLEFSRFLTAPNGSALRNAMATHGNLSGAGLAQLLERVRPLEFYMPVREHRTT